MTAEKKPVEVEEKSDDSKKSSWAKLKPSEVESKIIELAKEGKTPSEIGIILRDSHGVPKARQILNKKIVQVLKSNKIAFQTEKAIVEKRVENLKSHLEKNKDDYTAKRSLTKKLWALQKY